MANGIVDNRIAFKTVTDISLFDPVPGWNDEWLVAYYTPAWANRPSDYGMIIKFSAPSLQWGFELAFPTSAPSIYLRTSINGGAWSAWVRL